MGGSSSRKSRLAISARSLPDGVWYFSAWTASLVAGENLRKFFSSSTRRGEIMAERSTRIHSGVPLGADQSVTLRSLGTK